MAIRTRRRGGGAGAAAGSAWDPAGEAGTAAERSDGVGALPPHAASKNANTVKTAGWRGSRVIVQPLITSAACGTSRQVGEPRRQRAATDSPPQRVPCPADSPRHWREASPSEKGSPLTSPSDACQYTGVHHAAEPVGGVRPAAPAAA